ncbi:hypothetical protein D5018_03345 [Parashewanella curva]|uniref:Uncharacterized protein n=1 Tax=Parashewanella curva TaxID=2338552 RepID=A0A3L8Q0I4_9GAMM|nr:hypothetical protein [Parashewanella curva]RLV61144.1 hypothetical protein D5018_03345 [Parashewanella curva]
MSAPNQGGNPVSVNGSVNGQQPQVVFGSTYSKERSSESRLRTYTLSIPSSSNILVTGFLGIWNTCRTPIITGADVVAAAIFVSQLPLNNDDVMVLNFNKRHVALLLQSEYTLHYLSFEDDFDPHDHKFYLAMYKTREFNRVKQQFYDPQQMEHLANGIRRWGCELKDSKFKVTLNGLDTKLMLEVWERHYKDNSSYSLKINNGAHAALNLLKIGLREGEMEDRSKRQSFLPSISVFEYASEVRKEQSRYRLSEGCSGVV